MPFLSDHMLAKRQVNTVAREELWVSTFQIFVLIFFRKFRKSEIMQQVPEMIQLDHTGIRLIVEIKSVLKVAQHVTRQRVLGLFLRPSAFV